MFVKITACLVAGILLMYLSSARAQPAGNGNLTRIVGGNINIIRNFPYLIQVWKDGTFVCGGCLLSPLFVVTAAHCTVGGRPAQFSVIGGASKITTGGVLRRVQKIIRPGTFSLSNLDKDIAVFKLARPLVGDNIRPIGLYTDNVRQGMVLQVTGWGYTSENANQTPNQLRTMKVPILSKATCRLQYQGFLELTNTMFCAGKPQHDACTGDSGGPAVYRGLLAGIISFGRGCARPNFPGVYTGVNSMIKFIRNAMTQ